MLILVKMLRKIEYLGWPNCIEITNDSTRLVISTDFGPRILFYGLDETENILGWHPEAAVTTSLGTWKPYGGHRLWVAPENMPLSYAPDNEPIETETLGDNGVRMVPPLGAVQIKKEIRIELADEGSGVTVDHRLTNEGDDVLHVAAWALTIMRPGGEVVVPNEPFAPYGPETLLPVRSMALWSYTDFTDPRWKLEKTHVVLRVDESIGAQQKFGVLNKLGWAAYRWQGLTFVKRFDHQADAEYPDMNSNLEVYTAGGYVEMETLSPLKTLEPGESVQHQERWELYRGKDVSEI